MEIQFFVLVANDSKGAGIQKLRELEKDVTDAYRLDREVAADARTKESIFKEDCRVFFVEATEYVQ